VKRSGWTCGSKASDQVPDQGFQCFHPPAVHSALPVTRAPLARITQNPCYLSPPHAARVYAAYLSPSNCIQPFTPSPSMRLVTH
jgi:hypothetical protein